jgi:hypothetical protein
MAMIEAGLATRLGVIDTEKGSASLYSGEAPDRKIWEFDSVQLDQFNPDQYAAALKAAEDAGFDVVVIDSLSHAWIGKGGALDLVDQKGGNKFTGWKDVTPLHRKMVDGIIGSKAHVIATMRSKTEWVMEEQLNKKGEKVQVPRKIGTAPLQRDGMEYEFDVYGSLDWSHQIKISKSRCPALQDATGIKPDYSFWQPLFDWLKSAKPAPPKPETIESPSDDPFRGNDPPIRSEPSTKPNRLWLSNLISEAINEQQFNAVKDLCTAAYEAKHISDDDVAFLVPRLKNRKEQIMSVAGGAAEVQSKS